MYDARNNNSNNDRHSSGKSSNLTEEDEAEQLNQKLNDIVETGAKVGLATLGGMALLDILSSTTFIFGKFIEV